MKLGIVVYSNEAETVWNAFRLGNFALKEGDDVKTFLLANGVDSQSLDNAKFNITEQMETLVNNGGQILACGTCMDLRGLQEDELCPLATMKDLHGMIRESDKVLTF